MLADLQPSVETLFKWLSDSEVERLIAIRAVWQMMQQEIEDNCLLFGRKMEYYEKIHSSLAKLLQAIVGK